MSDIRAVENDADELIAWAAGLFDGEGSSSCYLPRSRMTRRRQMQVSQAGVEGTLPHVLVRFREIVGAGNITGPYRGYLYYWKTTRNLELDRIAVALWPFLGVRKKEQFIRMTLEAGRSLPFLPTVVAGNERRRELAWSAGLFDGEGSMWASGRGGATWKTVAMEIAQSSDAGVPEVLERFRSVLGIGGIQGPHPPRSPWSRLPQYRWSASGRHQVSRVLEAMWPWLGDPKRAQAESLKTWLDEDFDRRTTARGLA